MSLPGCVVNWDELQVCWGRGSILLGGNMIKTGANSDLSQQTMEFHQLTTHPGKLIPSRFGRFDQHYTRESKRSGFLTVETHLGECINSYSRVLLPGRSRRQPYHALANPESPSRLPTHNSNPFS